MTTKKKTTTLEEKDLVTERVGRRSSIAALGAAVLGTAALVGGIASEAEAQGCSDSDPNDPGGRGRHCGSGCSDRDPNDPVGNGRHCGRGPSGCSDRDPNDPVGNGRHCGYRSCSDRDPNDPVGRGRHC